jgi:hypothetical protein
MLRRVICHSREYSLISTGKNPFLKKSLAILFLSLFLLFHYDRLLNYLQCPLTPIVPAAAVKCDCGKPLPDPSAKGHPAGEKLPLKQRPEEVFAGNLLPPGIGLPIEPISGITAAKDAGLPGGFAITIFQPPRS